MNKIGDKLQFLKNKKLITSYIISFVLAFMMFFYEPLTMYLNNTNDFWFNLGIIIWPIIKMTLLIFVALLLLFTFIFIIDQKKFKKIPLFDICIIIFFVAFLCTYIQGNFLSNNLPPLDGTSIDWFGKEYLTQNIVSIVLWIVTSLITIVLTIKLKKEKVGKYIKYATIAVFFMLLVSLTTVIFTNKEASKNSNSIIVTSDNINNVSTNKNFFIFVIDATDSVIFDEEMSSKNKYKDLFKDFTYYKDTMAVYPFTRDSIPLMLSGSINNNEDDFSTYSTKALTNSEFLKRLKEDNYNINIYETELKWNDKSALDINNIKSLNDKSSNSKLNEYVYYKEQTKYILFKYLPFPLKKVSHVEKMDFLRSNRDLYHSSNIENYSRFIDNNVIKTEDSYFQFLHIDGAHVPFDLDKDVNKIENGTYEQKIQAMLTIIDAYLNRLKENNVYDNSVIMIMADHGYSYTGFTGRQNPILFIKGIDEHHDMIRSDIPVSYNDLTDAYLDLLDGKKSTDLFNNVDNSDGRIYMFYEYTKEDHMVEMIQKGKAWDEDTLIPTGREFNR